MLRAFECTFLLTLALDFWTATRAAIAVRQIITDDDVLQQKENRVKNTIY